MSNGSEEIIAAILIIGVVAGLIFLIYKLVVHFEKKKEENFKKLGRPYGLRFEKDMLAEYGTKKGPLLKGTIKGHNFVCYTYVVGAGKNATYWTAFKLQHNLNTEGYRLRLASEHIFRKMGKGLGLVKEIEIGVQDFDHRFLIDAENLTTTRTLLNKKTRDKLTDIPKMYFGELLVDNQEIFYKVPLQLSHDKSCENFKIALEAAILLLDDLKRVYR